MTTNQKASTLLHDELLRAADAVEWRPLPHIEPLPHPACVPIQIDDAVMFDEPAGGLRREITPEVRRFRLAVEQAEAVLGRPCDRLLVGEMLESLRQRPGNEAMRAADELEASWKAITKGKQ